MPILTLPSDRRVRFLRRSYWRFQAVSRVFAPAKKKTALRLEEYSGEEDEEYGSWVLLESIAGAGGEAVGDTPGGAPAAAPEAAGPV
jgi:hypothetical protein